MARTRQAATPTVERTRNSRAWPAATSRAWLVRSYVSSGTQDQRRIPPRATRAEPRGTGRPGGCVGPCLTYLDTYPADVTMSYLMRLPNALEMSPAAALGVDCRRRLASAARRAPF